MSHSKASHKQAKAPAAAEDEAVQLTITDETITQYIGQADAAQLKSLALQLRDECHRRGLAWVTVQAPD